MSETLDPKADVEIETLSEEDLDSVSGGVNSGAPDNTGTGTCVNNSGTGTCSGS